MAGILISPSIEQKILGRRAVWKSKGGNATFRDILRQRCRLRIKENRHHLISQLRGLDAQNHHDPLNDILRDEYKRFLKQFESTRTPDEQDEESWEMSKEPLSEEDEWLMRRFDLLFDDETLANMLEEADQVVCPLCLKGSLKEVSPVNIIRCDKCLMQVSACSSLPEINSRISHCLNVHTESGCLSNVSFLASCENGTQYLYVLCGECSYFDIVG